MFKYKEKYNIAIVGATGIVGEALLNILKSRDFPINEIVAIASKRSSRHWLNQKGCDVLFSLQAFRIPQDLSRSRLW